MKDVPYNTEYFTPYNQQPQGKPPSQPGWKRIYSNRIKVAHILHVKICFYIILVGIILKRQLYLDNIFEKQKKFFQRLTGKICL